MATLFTIDGTRVHDLASFYDELNRVFMAGEEWQLGLSLDALDDLLYGGYGALHGVERPRIVWRDHQVSAAALGADATEAWQRTRLARPGYDHARIQRELDALLAGTGPTYYELVLRVFADHPAIDLVLD